MALGGGTTGRNACALVDGEVWCWGKIFEGSTGTWVDVPAARVEALTGIDEVCLGGQLGCARDGTRVRCWDDFKTTELTRVGDRITDVVASTLAGAQQLACIGSYVCALRGDGRVGCLYGDAAMYGHGEFDWSEYRSLPVVIPGVVDAVDLVEGGAACAVQADGAVRCWAFGYPLVRGADRSGDHDRGYRAAAGAGGRSRAYLRFET